MAKKNSERRTRRVTVPYTVAEGRWLDRRAKAEAMGVATWIRRESLRAKMAGNAA